MRIKTEEGTPIEEFFHDEEGERKPSGFVVSTKVKFLDKLLSKSQRPDIYTLRAKPFTLAWFQVIWWRIVLGSIIVVFMTQDQYYTVVPIRVADLDKSPKELWAETEHLHIDDIRRKAKEATVLILEGNESHQ